MKTIPIRLILILGIILVAIIYTLPSIIPGWSVWPNKKINLGLDLQGGMHLVLDVQTEKAVESTIERISQEVKQTLRKEKIRHRHVKVTDHTNISLSIYGQKNIDKFEELLKDEYRDYRVVERNRNGDTLNITMNLPDQETDHIKKMAVDQALETIRNRIDQFGVSEPDIRRQGERRILIQLPGVEDPQRAKELIGKTALLEFKLVDQTQDVRTALAGKLAKGTEILYQVIEDPTTGRVQKNPYVLQSRTLLTGAYLTDARVEIDSRSNAYNVGIKFDKKGAKIFAKITEKNVNRRLAIVLDKRVYSAPNIQEKIPGGAARITGNFSRQEAMDLAIVLRAGALPAPVKILEERTVGPTLGADSIRKGILSMCIGGLLVVLFMLVYYKGAGGIADAALFLNILLIAGGLAAFQATLTLPGIAGIILTIGMAVDANVIIFERVREEIKLGKTPRSAVGSGYDRATLTILDANVTTLIAALVLFQFGTGPVKGFAVTLCLGIIASLFTALVVTRAIFDYFLIQRSVKTVSI